MYKTHFCLIGICGTGGFCDTFLLQDQNTKMLYVLKKVKEGLPEADRKIAAAAIKREAFILSGLDHPQIPYIYMQKSFPDGPVSILQHMPGISLRKYVHDNGPCTEKAALRIIRRLCTSLLYLHSQTPPLVHADIKPENILIDEENKIYLIDYGASAYSGETASGIPGGSFGYSPPWRFSDRRLDPSVDLFSVGAVLFYLLTAKDPSGDDHRKYFPVIYKNSFLKAIAPKPFSDPIRYILAHTHTFNQKKQFKSVSQLNRYLSFQIYPLKKFLFTLILSCFIVCILFSAAFFQNVLQRTMKENADQQYALLMKKKEYVAAMEYCPEKIEAYVEALDEIIVDHKFEESEENIFFPVYDTCSDSLQECWTEAGYIRYRIADAYLQEITEENILKAYHFFLINQECSKMWKDSDDNKWNENGLTLCRLYLFLISKSADFNDQSYQGSEEEDTEDEWRSGCQIVNKILEVSEQSIDSDMQGIYHLASFLFQEYGEEISLSEKDDTDIY